MHAHPRYEAARARVAVKMKERATQRCKDRAARARAVQEAASAAVTHDEFGNAVLVLVHGGKRRKHSKFYLIGNRAQNNQKNGPYVFFRALEVLCNMYVRKGKRKDEPLILFEGKYPLASAEHAFQWAKMRVLGLDDKTINALMQQHPRAAAIKAAADRHDMTAEQLREWGSMRYAAMHSALSDKFGQNADLAKILLRTRDFHLVLNAPRDALWGTGKSCENGTVFHGLNLMGKALMQVRSQLQMQYKQTQP